MAKDTPTVPFPVNIRQFRFNDVGKKYGIIIRLIQADMKNMPSLHRETKNPIICIKHNFVTAVLATGLAFFSSVASAGDTASPCRHLCRGSPVYHHLLHTVDYLSLILMNTMGGDEMGGRPYK